MTIKLKHRFVQDLQQAISSLPESRLISLSLAESPMRSLGIRRRLVTRLIKINKEYFEKLKALTEKRENLVIKYREHFNELATGHAVHCQGISMIDGKKEPNCQTPEHDVKIPNEMFGRGGVDQTIEMIDKTTLKTCEVELREARRELIVELNKTMSEEGITDGFEELMGGLGMEENVFDFEQNLTDSLVKLYTAIITLATSSEEKDKEDKARLVLLSDVAQVEIELALNLIPSEEEKSDARYYLEMAWKEFDEAKRKRNEAVNKKTEKIA